ncbi:MAG: type restriction-modification system methylase subunit [Anaerocolumna sp.]|nr:type restriction-modification system methylase subunit [Clostridia bacterium]MDF2951019.1 type restriction-modification system methylase subunit [Anaerocolumna sp.]
MMNFTDKANFIWSVADLLRGDFKQSEYGKVILPFTVLRRFDCVLAPTKDKILEMNKTLTVSNKTPIFKKLTGHDYYNVSQFDFAKLIDDSNAIDTNLRDYINGFSDDVKDILDKFEIFTVIEKLKKANLLYLVVQKFSELDLAADNVDNLEMGYMYEELIRRFSELSNETAGEHFTPREVIELMVDLLFDPDMDEMTKEGKVVTIFDPACGTGGMLSVAQNKMIATNTKTTVIPFGQELNPETYATCKSDMILKGNTNSKIVLGNSFSEDGFVGQTFDYMLSNPPFGVEWKKVEKFIKDEALNQGFSGRFGAGTPRISDGSLLFLQHMISKMTPKDKGGSRLGIVFNGSPLFTGDAGSGESEIRKWIIENDLLEAIVALPDQLFYNTGISTYVWILTNRKADRRKGKIRLVNGVSYFEKMRKSLGNKRNVINEQNRADLVRLYSMFEPHEDYKDFDNADFGYSKITVERPVYDNEGKPELDKKGNKKADSSLRDTEIVPLKEDINEYFKREVFPHVTDAWIDQSKTKIGYEIPFTRHFYKFVPLRVSADIMAEIKELEEKIAKNLLEVLAE